MENYRNTKPELLAPAGNLACALAAFDAGADAVYAGLHKFNARERSENFTFEQLGKLITYAHKIGKKVYLTLNTLIKEVEIKELIELLAEVEFLRPDAVIVQDLGVLFAIKNYFPNLVIHASTQMGVHNSAGIEILEKLGVQRIILERQVTLEEMAELVKKTTMEVEVFVHGALCCSLSGVCTFSSWLGGHSGNRGKCKQPCRRRFFSENGNGFFFSTQDLYTLDLIPKFREMGISSFKIEGRMKRADYIDGTVKAYRQAIDNEENNGEKLREQRNELSKASGRKWSHGFYTNDSSESLIQHKQLGVSGMLCGDVIRTEPSRFAIRISRRLHIGDKIRLQSRNGDEAPIMTLTKMFVDNKSVTKAVKGEVCSIPYDREVSYDAQVYKVGVSTEDDDARQDSLAEFKPSIDLKIKLDSKKIQISVENYPLEWEQEVAFEWAEKNPCTSANLIENLRATGESSFISGKSEAEIAGEWFIPNSVMKPIRKAFWEFVEKNLSVEMLKNGNLGLMKFYQDYKDFEDKENDYNRYFEASSDVYFAKPETHLPNKKIDVCRSIFSYDRKTCEVELPPFCSENRLENLSQAISRAYDDGIRRFRVTNLYQLALLQKFSNISITTSVPLPICNSFGVRLLKELGVKKVQAWVELSKIDMDKLVVASPLRVEIYRYGRFPLLVTRAKVATEGKITDSRNNDFFVKFDKWTKFTTVYASEALKIEQINNTDDFYDLTNASWGDRETSDFNFTKELS